MRIRPFAAVSAVAVTALLLAGCSGAPETAPESSPTPDAQCLLDAKPGKTSDAITISGSGADATVEVPADLPFEALERTIVTEGDGDDVFAGDLLSIRYQVVNAETNEVLDSSERGEGGVLPVLMDPQSSSLFVAALECEPLGSTAVLALPASVLGGEGAQSLVVYAESVGKLPTIASGTPVDPAEGMPTVKLDKDGAPTITIPEGTEPPAETRVEMLQQGDGAEVQPGDLVVVQYRGVKWSDGEEFDSSWSREATPTQFQTNQVVNGFRLALEGQKVGSQVLVAMTPADGYGEAGGTHELSGESLVFVVDILATTPVQPAQ
ncbi:peptidylprolyl isomerase [Microbacterium keratanolyticum]|uniref:peptidylprolyl isomerase n=1 Tax=Microbacterium keratanolyticum TaxID=67574 RepID=A0A9W6M9Q1_9MICO|nr:FKBP-type peptidyl-prolyl cis-trans isomerase [Microbacterium keratanolyticum]MBM7467808.1 peptidylprolyl isomerase [Microbacterium keratanolyticum]GLK02798.1 peptidylprolyl isomerase [Microbacterium keratanolyticum]